MQYKIESAHVNARRVQPGFANPGLGAHVKGGHVMALPQWCYTGDDDAGTMHASKKEF